MALMPLVVFSRTLFYALDFGGGLDRMDFEAGRAGSSCLVSCTNVISLLLKAICPFLHFSSLYLLDFRESPLQVLLGSLAMWRGMACVRCDSEPAGASGGFKQCFIFVFTRVFR